MDQNPSVPSVPSENLSHMYDFAYEGAKIAILVLVVIISILLVSVRATSAQKWTVLLFLMVAVGMRVFLRIKLAKTGPMLIGGRGGCGCPLAGGRYRRHHLRGGSDSSSEKSGGVDLPSHIDGY